MKHPAYDMTRQQVYDSKRSDKAIVLNEVIRREIFWLNTQKNVTFSAYGIKFTLRGQEYHYDVYDENGLPDMAFREKHIGREFRIQYDPHDMSVVRLCTYDKKTGYQFISEATPKITVHRAISEHEEGEMQFIQDVAYINKKARVRRHLEGAAIDSEFGLAPEQHGYVSPRPAGITKEEYESLCDEIYAEGLPVELPEVEEANPYTILPDSLGQIEKEMSNLTFDQAAAYDRM